MVLNCEMLLVVIAIDLIRVTSKYGRNPQSRQANRSHTCMRNPHSTRWAWQRENFNAFSQSLCCRSPSRGTFFFLCITSSCAICGRGPLHSNVVCELPSVNIPESSRLAPQALQVYTVHPSKKLKVHLVCACVLYSNHSAKWYSSQLGVTAISQDKWLLNYGGFLGPQIPS